ncbi:MAG: hypothetical protein GY869_18920, partial [Planctomycetes bacterium]|nr:hypothetical protein [Planctomycetota bacterium]
MQPSNGTLYPLDSAMELTIVENWHDEYLMPLDIPCLIVYTRKAYPATGYRHLLWASELDLQSRQINISVFAVQFICPGCAGQAMTNSAAVRPLDDLTPGVYTMDLAMHYPDQAPVIDHYQINYFPYDSMKIYPPCGDSSQVYGS